MASPKTTTIKVSLEDVEMLTYALYVFDRSQLDDRQRGNMDKLEDRLARAEDRLL